MHFTSPCRPAPQRRGFAIFVVMVVLLLLSVMAIAYLSTIRYRLQAKVEQGGNIQMVAGSVLNDIKGAIQQDYPFKGSLQEPYDYPWTASGVASMPYKLGVPRAASGSASGFTKGDPLADDAWLASSSPTAAGIWPHLTNLKGGFLDVTTSDLSRVAMDPSRRRFVPTDSPSNNTESNVALTDQRLVDTDGDGLGDALWFYPTISVVNNRRYVAAVYIEDLSAKLNVNTALPLRNGGAYASATGPLGLSSADVDLSAAVPLWSMADADLAALLSRRTGGVLSGPLDHVQRMRYWGEWACRALGDGSPLGGENATVDVATGNRRYGWDDAVELGYHGGLNRKDTTTDVETRLPLRSTATENDYTAVAASPYSYFRNNPRRWLTAYSGECLEQKGIDVGMLNENIRYDVNCERQLSGSGAAYDPFASWTAPRAFNGTNSVAGDANDHPAPGWLQHAEATAASRPARLASVLTANAFAMKGGNKNHGGVARSGNMAGSVNGWVPLAPLPVLTEAYLQCHMCASANSSGGTTASKSGGAEYGYCLEFHNPLRTPVKLNGIIWTIHVAGVAWLGSKRLDSDLAGWPVRDQDGDCVLLPGQTLLLYRNGNAAGATAGTVSAATTTNLGMPGTKATAAATASATDPVTGQKMVIAVNSSAAITGMAGTGPQFAQVEMWAPLPDNDPASNDSSANGKSSRNYIAYHYLTVPMPAVDAVENVTGKVTNDSIGIVQSSAKRWNLDTGLDLLQCRPARQNRLSINRPTGVITYSTTASDNGDAAISYVPAAVTFDATKLDTLGKSAKGTAFPGGARPSLQNDSLWFASEDWHWSGGRVRYRNPGRFRSLADMMRVPMVAVRGRGDATCRPAGLNNLNQSGSFYTDTDVAHWLYAALCNPSAAAVSVSGLDGTAGDPAPVSVNAAQPWPNVSDMVAAGYPALDALRLHPWAASASQFKWYSTQSKSRQVPWGWMHELLWSSGFPGLSGGYDWTDADGDANTLTQPKWVDGNGNTTGLDANANNYKDWPGECDFAESTAFGRLNLNTAPQWLLAEALPIRDATVRANVATLIATRRDAAPYATGTRGANDRGVAYMAELLPALRAEVIAGAWDMDGSGTYDAASDASLDTLLRVVGPLWQTTSPRSDYFLAHILVQGYDANNFTKGAIESARQMVILRRTSSGAQVIGQPFNY